MENQTYGQNTTLNKNSFPHTSHFSKDATLKKISRSLIENNLKTYDNFNVLIYKKLAGTHQDKLFYFYGVG